MFINCPYDDDYRWLLLAIIFTTIILGYNPRLALENSDCGEIRIDKIARLIKESKYSIHDLSRLKSSRPNEFYRLNMPFELGMDFGCRKLLDGKFKEKKFLILETELYRYKKALSDLSGIDIKAHKDDLNFLFESLRDWFVENTDARCVFSATKIKSMYIDFQGYLRDESIKLGFNESNYIQKLTITEHINYAKAWKKYN